MGTKRKNISSQHGYAFSRKMSLKAQAQYWQNWHNARQEARIWFATNAEEERKYLKWLENPIPDNIEEELRKEGVDFRTYMTALRQENEARHDWLCEGKCHEDYYAGLLDDEDSVEDYLHWLDYSQHGEYCEEEDCEDHEEEYDGFEEAELERPSHKRMHRGDTVYHVTNQPCDNPNPAKRPKWCALRGHHANNPHYDGVLFGKRGVFFSTNLTSFGYGLPTRSPYPTRGISGRRYWRAKIRLAQFANYSFSLITANERQVLLCATKSGEETLAFRNRHRNVMPLCKADNDYLRCTEDGRWYVRVYDSNYDPCFVNLFVPGNFPLEDAEWDSVERL